MAAGSCTLAQQMMLWCNVQGATLLEIKKSFRDVDNVLYEWTNSPSSDFCVWRGVTCDDVNFNVVALNLSNMKGAIQFKKMNPANYDSDGADKFKWTFVDQVNQMVQKVHLSEWF
ncbi:hypothetical protein ACFE04_002161 [Oxalis oulophora]